MIKNYLLVLACFFLALATTATGQNIKEKDAAYTTIRLPLQPVEGNASGYTFTVSTPYPQNTNDLKAYAEERYQAELASYDDVVAESKVLHQQALERYDEEVEMARENFKLESEEFKKMSFVERMAMADQKPKLKLPRKPIYRKPAEPYYREPNVSRTIVIDPKVLADSYLNIDGFDAVEGDDDAIKGEVIMYDFESFDPETEVREETYYNKSAKKNMTRKVTYYITRYKRPVELNLTYNGTVLHSGIFGETGEFLEIDSKSRPNMFNIEKETMYSTLSDIKEYINVMHGYTPIEIPVAIHYVKNKKELYNDLEEARELAISAYASFDPDAENDELLDAMDIWKKAMEESDLEDRKARIDKGVTEALLFNLVEANIALKNVEDSQKYLSQLKKMRLNYREKQQVETYEGQIADLKSQLEANGM